MSRRNLEPTCREARDVLAVWAETTDLPEGVAIHLDGCPSCREAFDRRFPRFPILPEPVDPAIRARWIRPRRPAGPLILAAATILAVASTLMAPEARDAEIADLLPPDCPDEAPWSLPECPPA